MITSAPLCLGVDTEPPAVSSGCRNAELSSLQDVHAEPPAAVGKPSFAYFPVDYHLPHADLRGGDLPDATPPYERSEDIGPNRRKPRIGAVRLASAKTDPFIIILPSQQFWLVK
ncbi:hypothetical protein THAOC_28737 [Thalassiosira oceanica]|uniref:Uncharacterized protein n=1 Tax=Thalassiosira oceanica TaxID=159749 RepID=K0RZH2_THAOC|nr:hypothetical protein THAOC_28737 [Thalassiosira oceanica]|eukprot:EJK52037.1 hypothetical protein THAOC_28737 [Thalassiosira oceanica]